MLCKKLAKGPESSHFTLSRHRFLIDKTRNLGCSNSKLSKLLLYAYLSVPEFQWLVHTDPMEYMNSV